MLSPRLALFSRGTRIATLCLLLTLVCCISHSRRLSRVYLCGYNMKKLAEVLLPDYELMDESRFPSARRGDILLIGMHLQCNEARTFPGKVVYVNGESYGHTYITHSYYLGPINDQVSVYQPSLLYYVSFAALELPGSTQAFAQRPTNSGEHFLLYLSSRCLLHRQLAFDALSKIAEVTAGGDCHGISNDNYNSIFVDGIWTNSPKFYKKFKFALVMENTDISGYVTEKLLAAFIGGTIPIYYGTEEVFKIFNKKAFVFYNESCLGDVMKQVRFLHTNHKAYQAMLSEPILAEGAYEKYFWRGTSHIQRLRAALGINHLPSQF